MTIHIKSIVVGNPDITSQCWNWCSEQTLIHQTNIATQNLFIVALAMASLVVNHTILQFHDEIIEYSDIRESVLEKIYTGTATFAFYLLAIFLIYNTLLN